MSWVAVAVSVAGTALSYENTRETQNKQNNALNSELQQQRQSQDQANARTQALLKQQAASTDTGDKAKSLGAFTQQLQQHQSQINQPLQSVGATSDAYKKAGSDAALGISTYGNNFADNVASIDAPTQQRQRDAIATDHYQNDINQIGNFARGNDFLAQMRLRNIHRNPWMDLGSEALGVAGGAIAKGGLGSLFGGTQVPNSPQYGIGGGTGAFDASGLGGSDFVPDYRKLAPQGY